MFSRKKVQSALRPVPHREEHFLIQALEVEYRENVYFLGLLNDYSLRGLRRMGWGEFYIVDDPFPQVLYQDVTGLVVTSRAEGEALIRFAEFLEQASTRTTRIIARAETADELQQRLIDLSPRWEKTRAEFHESGMVLERENLPDLFEPALRMARPDEAEALALGSARAMNEEIGIESTARDFDRLVRSKADLIERNRYYILEEHREIVFQAYLNAQLPLAGQVQGVWVPPEHRNRGVATRCLAEMCRRCLETSGVIVLRVQTRNLPALRAYEKVGFVHYLDYRSIWYI